MTEKTGTVAESLEPPFVAAIFSDTAIVRHLSGAERRPSDEMVSMAPVQPGFLGLETSRDEKGRWLSVCYWKDMAAYNGWRNACVDHLSGAFPDTNLESLCQIRVATVDRPVPAQRRKHLKAEAPAPTSEHPATYYRLLDAYPSIAELFGHAHVR